MFGMVGNSICFLVLNGSNMRNSTFNVLLNVLIIVDNIFIMLAILDYAFVRGTIDEKEERFKWSK